MFSGREALCNEGKECLGSDLVGLSGTASCAWYRRTKEQKIRILLKRPQTHVHSLQKHAQSQNIKVPGFLLFLHPSSSSSSTILPSLFHVAHTSEQFFLFTARTRHAIDIATVQELRCDVPDRQSALAGLAGPDTRNCKTVRRTIGSSAKAQHHRHSYSHRNLCDSDHQLGNGR